MPDADGAAASDPFLTAVIPGRPGGSGAIGEALLSLAAQTCSDFEVIVVVEGADPRQLEEFEEITSKFESGFRSRVHVQPSPGAGSAVAMALEAARGDYLAVIEPDDVAFAHWVEAFASIADANKGSVLRSLVVTQEVERSGSPDRYAYTSIDRPRAVASQAMGLGSQVSLADGSLHGLALPRGAVAGRPAVPAGADPAIEEWALALSAVIHCGVAETGEVTYLRRVIAGTGRADPTGSDNETRRAIAVELDGPGLTLPVGTLVTLVELSAQINALRDEVAALADDLDRATQEAGRLATAQAGAERQLDEMRDSASWRLSRPVRIMGTLAREWWRRS